MSDTHNQKDSELEMLVNAMQTTQSRFMNLCFQAFTVALVALGWSAAANDAEPLICPENHRWFVTIVVLFFCLIFFTLLETLRRKQVALAQVVGAVNENYRLLARHYEIKLVAVLGATMVMVILALIFILGVVYAGSCIE